MSKPKIGATHIFFGIVNTLRDQERISTQRERNRSSMKTARAGLVEAAKTLISDQADDETLKNWARHAVISGSADLMNSFPCRAPRSIVQLRDYTNWPEVFQTCMPDHIQACFSRGIDLFMVEVNLLRRAVTEGDPTLQDILLEIPDLDSPSRQWIINCRQKQSALMPLSSADAFARS